MAGMGRYGQTVRWGGSGFGGGGASKQPKKTTYENYVQPNPKVPDLIQAQIDYTKDIPTGITAADQLAMRNRIRATDTAQNQGSQNRIRELMAAQGLSGSGAEVSALGGMMRGQNAARQGALSNLDLSNAQLNLANQYQRGNMLNQLTGMGEGARQFDVGGDRNMYQFGTQFDEGKRQFNVGRDDYQQQLQEWLRRMNSGGFGR